MRAVLPVRTIFEGALTLAGDGIARVNCARFSITAVLWGVTAISCQLVADVIGARIAVRTVFPTVDTLPSR